MIGIVKPFSVLCEAFVAEMIQQRNLLGFADLFRGMNTESLWYESWGEVANISWICCFWQVVISFCRYLYFSLSCLSCGRFSGMMAWQPS